MKRNINQILIAFLFTVLLAACHDHDDFILPQQGENSQVDSTWVQVRRNEFQKAINNY